jgi:hypothetical protein
VKMDVSQEYFLTFQPSYVPQDLAEFHVANGHLKRVLEDWCAPFMGGISTTQADGM